jgi:hypothetical protein
MIQFLVEELAVRRRSEQHGSDFGQHLSYTNNTDVSMRVVKQCHQYSEVAEHKKKRAYVLLKDSETRLRGIVALGFSTISSDNNSSSAKKVKSR